MFKRYLSEYYTVFKDRKDFLIASCKDNDEVEIVERWLKEWAMKNE